MNTMSFFWGVGRRKTSVARVRLFPGGSGFMCNGRPMKEYIANPDWENHAFEPLKATETTDKVGVMARVDGGGKSGQAGALRQGLARALVNCDPNLKPILRKAGMLSRDDRMVERKKPGLKGARKRPQYSKR
jgi:small subunit ribosomal protein S9